MNDREYELVQSFFKRYGALASIDQDFEQHSTASHIISSPVLLTASFASTGRFNRFVYELEKLDELHYEEYIRQKNPSVARAYEEYQILLKLSK